MTAFGRAGCDLVQWEIRSVNHRYLELGFRLPASFRDLEQPLRQLTAGRIRRGKVDAKLEIASQAAVVPRLNEDALKNLLAAVDGIRGQVAVERIDPLDLMRWPGVLEDDQDDLAHFKEAAVARYGDALDNLVAHRRSEGASLDTLLRERLEVVERSAAEVRALATDQAAILRQRLHSRVRELTTRLDAERLEQEVALLAQKADVAEELDRLDIHVAEARASLNGSAPCGRRLDFLTQEMNREVNTLAAKLALPAAGRLAVDLKVAIEQIREQAQNVE